MYKDGLVVSIKSGNGYLKEVPGNVNIVRLKDGSDYSVYIKNTTGNRYKAEVLIDGTFVTGDRRRVIINPYSSTTLSRFILDGNLSQGQALTFVSTKNSKVQDPTSSQNGLIQVRFFKELPQINHNPMFFAPTRDWFECEYGPRLRTISTSSLGTAEGYSASLGFNEHPTGATIPGKLTNQEFTVGPHFETESSPSTVISLQMLLDEPTRNLWYLDAGVDMTIKTWKDLLSEIKKAPQPAVKETPKPAARYCQHCGKEVEPTDQYCRHCGKKL